MALEADLFTILLPRRPRHGPSAEQVEMKMKYGLSAVPTAVGHNPIAVLGQAFLAGYCGAGQQQMAEDRLLLLTAFAKRAHVFSGNHQNMCGSLGVEVLKGHTLRVLMDDLGGKASRCNTAKETVTHQRLLPRAEPDEARTCHGGQPAPGRRR